MAGPIRIAILANAIQARREMRSVSKDARKMGKDVEKSGSGFKSLERVSTSLKGKLRDVTTVLAKATTAVGAISGTLITLAPYALTAAKAVVKFGTSALQAAPLAAGLAASTAFIVTTLKLIAPAVGQALTPLKTKFDALTKSAGRLASKGLKPLAAQVANSAAFVALGKAMDTIAIATNKVVKDFLKWIDTKRGTSAVVGVVQSGADAFQSITPHALKFAEALASMLGRVTPLASALGAKGLNGLLDAMTKKLDGINRASVQKGLDGLRSAFESVKRTVVNTVQALTVAKKFYDKYKVEITAISDGFAILAIAFGGPALAITAAVGLIIRHWNDLKKGYAELKTLFQTKTGTEFIDNIRAAVDIVWPAVRHGFQQIKTAVLPTLKSIGKEIKEELIPAFGQFIKAVAPLVAFFVKKVAPVVARVMKGVLAVVQGTIRALAGILNVATGLLTGDWKRVWAGFRQIVSGVWTAVRGIIKVALSDIGHLFSSSLLIGAGERLMSGLVTGIRRRIGAAVQAVRDGLSKIKGMLPGSPIKTGPLKSWNNGGAGKRLIGLLTQGVNRGTPGFKTAISNALSGSTSASGISLSGSRDRGGFSPIINFNSIVGDPAEAGRQVLDALNKYGSRNGRGQVRFS